MFGSHERSLIIFFRTLNNYLMWHVVKTMTPYLSDQFRDARRILTEAISGEKITENQTSPLISYFFRTLNNYLMWHVVKTMTPYLADQFRDARRILTEAISGEKITENQTYLFLDHDITFYF